MDYSGRLTGTFKKSLVSIGFIVLSLGLRHVTRPPGRFAKTIHRIYTFRIGDSHDHTSKWQIRLSYYKNINFNA